MPKHDFAEIKLLAAQGELKESWETLMDKVGILENAKNGEFGDFWYQTDGWTSSSKMEFVNDVLPNHILQKDDSYDMRETVSVLSSFSSAYNISSYEKADNFQVSNYENKMKDVMPYIDGMAKYVACSRAADFFDRASRSKNLTSSNRKEQLVNESKKYTLEAFKSAPDMEKAYNTALTYNRKFDDYAKLSSETIELLKEALKKPKVKDSDFPVEFYVYDIIANNCSKKLDIFKKNNLHDVSEAEFYHSKALEFAPDDKCKKSALQNMYSFYHTVRDDDKKKEVYLQMKELETKSNTDEKSDLVEEKTKFDFSKKKEELRKRLAESKEGEVSGVVKTTEFANLAEKGVKVGETPSEHKQAEAIIKVLKNNNQYN